MHVRRNLFFIFLSGETTGLGEFHPVRLPSLRRKLNSARDVEL
jgi:hypothetical protein